MTTESVLKKLKRYRELSNPFYEPKEDDADLDIEGHNLCRWYRRDFLPNIIDALELVEEKANREGE